MPFLNCLRSRSCPARTPAPSLNWQAMKLTDNVRLVPIRCRKCQSLITRMRLVHDSNIPVWCLACLAKHPKASFRQRLKAYRLAAGLTLAALAKRCSVKR